MRLLLRSPTKRRPLESRARACGMSNSPGPVPFFPQVLMNFPSLENFTMRLFDSPPWPSATKMSPLGATTTSDGMLNVSGPLPATPALPSVSRTFPSGENLKTWCPFPSFPWPSVTHTLPSLSAKMPWGNTNMPAPKLFSSLPEVSNSRIGASFEPAQELAPHRSATQIWSWASTSTPAVDPHVRPSGSLAQSEMVRYGLGCALGSLEPTATATAAKRIGPASIHAARFWRVIGVLLNRAIFSHRLPECNPERSLKK